LALRQIRLKGDAMLQKKTKPVTEITPNIIQLLDDMKQTMDEKEGVGIAAPQVGILRRIAIIAHEDEYYELINPEIIEENGSQNCNEACLSVEGLCGDVQRPFEITVKYLTREWQEETVTVDDFMAAVFCHEIDHLDGVLFTDKAVNVRPLDEDERRKRRRRRRKVRR